MLKQIHKRWHNDGIFFALGLWSEAVNLLLSRVVSATIGKRVKIVFPCRVRGWCYIQMGDNFTCGSGLWLEAIDSYFAHTYSPQILISDDVSLSNNVHIACINRISIGSGVLIGSNVFIGDHQHGNLALDETDQMPKFRGLHSRGPIAIGNNVWIGDGVCISDNVNIGANSIIGAHSVVLGDIPANSVAVGSPARVVKCLVDNRWVKV